MILSEMSSRITVGRVLFTLNALLTSFGPFLADWNETHIYNPRWPPHAKFHNGQTMSMGLLLGLATLYYTWAKTPKNVEAEKTRLGTIVLLDSLYWVTQASGWFYPDSSFVDPEFDGGGPPGQMIPIGICVCLVGGGWLTERQRIKAIIEKGK